MTRAGDSATFGEQVDERVDLFERKQLTVCSAMPLLPAALALGLGLLRLADAP